jgi:hypothetical protein
MTNKEDNMGKRKAFLYLAAGMVLLLPLMGCACLKIRDMPPTADRDQIVKNNVVVEAAVLPGGDTVSLSIEDYCPRNEGKNELKVSWSQTDSGNAEYATILFPEQEFGDGPSKVHVFICHYNSCTLKAYDEDGNLLSTAVHEAGQNTVQRLTLSGGKIRKIEIIGAEIGIRDICYCKNPFSRFS